jgi:hypothetical protein
VALKKIFQSVPIPYRLPAARGGIPSYPGLHPCYNPWLITPPRIYSENPSTCQVLWVTREQLLDSYTVLNMWLWGDQIYWPGWEIIYQRFDATSGAALATLDEPSSALNAAQFVAFTKSITAAFDGSLWRNSLNVDLTQMDPATLAAVRGPYNYVAYAGLVGFGIPVVDPANDILITSNYGLQSQILIYHLTTGGAPIASFSLPGNAVDICPVGSTSTSTLFYVLTADNILCLCDYSTAAIVSEFLLPADAYTGAIKLNLAWDPVRNLLLVYSQKPDNLDGSSASLVRGYYPVPAPERLTVPIPLLPPRQYKPTPVAARLLGDLGHPVSSVNVTGSVISTTPVNGAVMTRPTSATNANGYALMQFTPSLQCTVDFQATANI